MLPAMSRIAWAQPFPTRPVRLIVGYPAGNGPDIAARLIGRWLSARLGQQFLIEDRPGASSNLATETLVKAPPDGYTLLLATGAIAINATLSEKFNFIRDITPVASIGRAPFVMVVGPSFPAKTVPEFIAYAKANPGKINMASSGNGSGGHVDGALFMMMAGVELVHVPYRVSYMPDLLGGQVQVAFNPITASIEYIRAGKLRALAVTTATRAQTLPDIPTVGEFLPGYEASAWWGVVGPKKISEEIVDKLNKQINAGLADAELKANLANLGGDPTPMTAAEFGEFITQDTEKWAKVIEFAGIKTD